MKKIGSVAVQKMYKRFKNRVLRKKGVEEKKRRLPKLVSSEPLIDLRCQASSVVTTAAVDSGLSIVALSPPFVQDAVRPSAQLTTPSHSTATQSERDSSSSCSCIATTCSSSCTTTYTTTSAATDLLSARRATDGAVCSVASPTPSCSSTCTSAMNTGHTAITAESSSRARLHGTPATTTTIHHPPMLSADSGVEVDCCCLESCCSCADVDDVFTDDEGEGELVDDDGWRIAAHDVSLDRVLTESSCETVYSGYWHGSVEIHSRRSSDDELVQAIASDIDALSCIRHENIQLFLGVCHNLHYDSISIVMDQIKGQSLHSLVHRQGHEFSFQSATKIMRQIAQGMEYLHAKGIPHPLLTTRAVTFHYRVCISMLTPCGASQGLLDSDDIIYLPPEAVRTVHQAPSSAVLPSQRCVNSPLKCDPDFMHTESANIFSYGTLVYELMTMERPFAGVAANNVIWEVGNERLHPLGKLQEGCRFRQIVSSCWRVDEMRRPSFEDLVLTLENNMSPRACGIKSPFSFSEPSQLAKLGL